jgi:hypothetical protein
MRCREKTSKMLHFYGNKILPEALIGYCNVDRRRDADERGM